MLINNVCVGHIHNLIVLNINKCTLLVQETRLSVTFQLKYLVAIHPLQIPFGI